MKTVLRRFSQFQFAVEMDSSVKLPLEVKAWLLTKDHPFDSTHIMYTVNHAHKRIVAFEYSEDAYYFIAWIEQLGLDVLDSPGEEDSQQ